MVVHAHYPVREPRVLREARALVERGFDVDVICLRRDGEAARDQHEGVSIRRLPIARYKRWGLGGQLVEYLAFFALATLTVSWRHLRRRYDSVQVHNLPDFLVFAAWLPRLTGTPVVLDLHDLMPEFFAARAGVGLGDPRMRAVVLQERLSCRFASHVITVSETWRDTLIARGTPADKVSVVMNIADPRTFKTTNGVRHDNGNFDLVYHGTWTERYGVDLIIDAVRVLRSDVPELRLRIFGDGPQRQALADQVARLGIGDRVSLSETLVSDEDLAGYIASADLGVVPNRNDVFTDGIIPTKLMEYVAVGTPAIVSRTSGISAYFDDTMVAFFEPGDLDGLAERIRELHGDEGKRVELAKGARSFQERHDWKSTAQDYVALVDGLITQ